MLSLCPKYFQRVTLDICHIYKIIKHSNLIVDIHYIVIDLRITDIVLLILKLFRRLKIKIENIYKN